MIAGILKRKESELNVSRYSDTILDVLNHFNVADQVGYWSNESILLCSTERYLSINTQKKNIPYISQDKDLVIAFWGELTNREELIHKLNENNRDDLCFAEIINLSYRKWGQSFAENIYGDYSVAIYDIREQELICCVDHMGVKPLYYYIDDNIFVFSSTLALFQKLELTPTNPDMGWTARYILKISQSFEKTAYTDILKLPPAHQLKIGSEKQDKRQYFTFNGETQLSNVTFEQCIEQYRTLLEHAVKSRIQTNYPLGSETSGGIDSSTITALAASNYGADAKDFHTFGFVNHTKEAELILLTSHKHKIYNNHIYCGNRAITEAISKRSLDVIGYPCEHLNAISHHIFYEECFGKNVRTLLSGFGGDEFVTTIHTNIAISELIKEGKYAKLYKCLRGNRLTAFLRLLKHIYNEKYSAKPEYNPSFLISFQERWANQPINKKVVEAYALKDKFIERARFDAGYSNLNRFTLKNRFAPFVPTRMNNCTLMADSYGIAYAWPLLDVQLIAFFLSIPTEYKIGKMGRYFHRKAMEGIVPDEVLWKPKKDMRDNSSLPFSPKNEVILNEDLHRDLENFFDIKALRAKLIYENKTTGESFIPRMFIQNINMIDLWLKKFHPNGANWQNTY